MNKNLFRCGLLVLAGAAAAGAVDVSGPIAGYVTDAGVPVLRAITGVPGSYLFSDPLELPTQATRVHPATGKDFALVQRGGSGFGLLLLNGSAVERVAELPGAMDAADWVAFSPASAAAILYSSQSKRMQVVTGLPEAPRVGAMQDMTSLGEQPGRGAVSDDGTVLLLATAQSVYRVTREGGPELILSTGHILGLELLRSGSAAVAERGTNSIRIVENLSGSVSSRVLVSGLSGMGRIYPSADGQGLFVSRPEAKSIALVNLESGDVRSFETATVPLELVPLRNRDTFLISARPGSPGGIFYRDGNDGRVVVIPALQQKEEAQ